MRKRQYWYVIDPRERNGALYRFRWEWLAALTARFLQLDYGQPTANGGRYPKWYS